MKFLFICTGNTCRSPMAEHIAKKIFKEHQFSSAGLCANECDKISKNAILALKDFDINISSHNAKSLSHEMINDYDYLIPMTSSHKNHLIMLGVSNDKILSFNDEILDPFGSSYQIYKNCAQQLKDNIKLLIGELNDNKTK